MCTADTVIYSRTLSPQPLCLRSRRQDNGKPRGETAAVPANTLQPNKRRAKYIMLWFIPRLGYLARIRSILGEMHTAQCNMQSSVGFDAACNQTQHFPLHESVCTSFGLVVPNSILTANEQRHPSFYTPGWPLSRQRIDKSGRLA